MRARLCVDAAVGEMRRVLLDHDGRPFRLDLERWSERERRARLDEIWWGRVQARMPGNRGWFVDLGLEREGVVEPTRAAAVVEGALLAFRIKSEAWADKGPVLSLADMSSSMLPPGQPQRHAAPADDPFLRGVEVVEKVEGPDARYEIDNAVNLAMATTAVLPGGGDIAIDITRGMVAVDVDAGSRIAEHDSSAFALGLNLAAVEVTARCISLKGVAGLVVVDFLRMDARRSQREVAESFRRSLARYLGRKSEVLELSPLGLCEAAIARRARPAADALLASDGEREALDALRMIESVGISDRARPVRAKISTAAKVWLDRGVINWQGPLAERIGARWTLEPVEGRAGPPEVWSAA